MKIYYHFLGLLGALFIAGLAYGQSNTGYGEDALDHNDSGVYNTAFGFSALFYNFSGNYNSGTGTYALFNNVAGNNNTATGYEALYGTDSSINNNNNTATGYEALFSDVTGSDNTASGYEALYFDSDGSGNTASGIDALYHNTTGNNNTATGRGALQSNKTGSNNIAEGFEAGLNLTTGSNNIDIGNEGVAADAETIRIGTAQTATFIAGIAGTSVSGNAVMISSSGQLGVVVSSERYKTAIAPMGSTSEKLAQLRPVTFHLKTNPDGALQYGLIAEEVAKVYPDLVVRDKSGRIDGVRYDELAPILVKEVQKQAADIKRYEQGVAEMRKELAELHAAFLKLQAKDELLARR